ncbi:putative signal transducing protein [Sphingobacterium corticis]|uniref:Signal transducing protein n=1 Tax=Sphingobacterium corticis TaxID=1812823 RepID=A0ABW5NG39_9SPHI
MEPGWIKIKTFGIVVEAEIVKNMLIENDIPAVVVNKQDVYVRFGNVELYVQDGNQEAALQLIDEQSENTND